MILGVLVYGCKYTFFIGRDKKVSFKCDLSCCKIQFCEIVYMTISGDEKIRKEIIFVFIKHIFNINISSFFPLMKKFFH